MATSGCGINRSTAAFAALSRSSGPGIAAPPRLFRRVALTAKNAQLQNAQARATESLALACESRLVCARAAPTPAPMNHPGQSPSICSCSWPVHCISAAVARRKARKRFFSVFDDSANRFVKNRRSIARSASAAARANRPHCGDGAKGSGWPLHALRLVTDWLSSNHAWRFPFPNGYSQPASVLTCGSGSAFSLFPGPNFFSNSIHAIPFPWFSPASRCLRTACMRAKSAACGPGLPRMSTLAKVFNGSPMLI